MAIRALLRRMTLLDKAIVFFLLFACAASFFYIGGGSRGERLLVERDGRVIFTFPLKAERTVSLEGALGTTTLSIHDGKVCILDSPCPLKVCMGMGEVSRSGQLLACIPNHLLVRIEGEEEKEPGYDLLSR